MTQRSRYNFLLRSRTIHGRFYVEGKLVTRSLGTFAQWGYGPGGEAAPLPLPKRQRVKLDRELTAAWDALNLQLQKEGAARQGRGRPLLEVCRDYFRAAPETRWSAEAERLLGKDILPALGRRGVRALRRGEVAARLDAIAARGAPVSARRTLAALRRVLAWAVERDELEANPCAGLRPPGRETPRARVLDAAEVGRFWLACDRLAPRGAALLRLILLTGQRPGEVRTMAWADLQPAECAWEIPASRYKTGRAHRVPLGASAWAIVQDQPREGPWVFPGRRRGRRRQGAPAATDPLDRSAVAGTMRRLGLAATPHDLRRTARSHLARLGTPDHVAERLLGHGPRGILATYNRYAYERELREAAEAWAAEVQRLAQQARDEAARAAAHVA